MIILLQMRKKKPSLDGDQTTRELKNWQVYIVEVSEMNGILKPISSIGVDCVVACQTYDSLGNYIN